MKRLSYIICVLFVIVLSLSGCKKSEEELVEGTGVFYLNTEGTGLVKKAYTLKQDDKREQIEELLGELQKETESIDYVSVVPIDVEMEKWRLQGDKLHLYFSVNYNEMDSASEILLRAAFVQTLTQIEGVEYVDFYAAEQPVTDNKGDEIGYQNEDDFVQNIGSTLHSYQKVDLNLYFIGKDGKKLVKESRSVRYNSNMSVEKLIVEKLLEGPVNSELQAGFVPKTKALGVSVKDGTCYVNFDESFLTNTLAVDPKLVVYSLVNSIVDSGNAMKVQILVNGETNVKYQETIDLSQPFSRNLDVIEGENK